MGQVHETIQVQDKASVELVCCFIFSTHRRFCLFRNFIGYMLFLFRRNNDGIVMRSCQCDFELPQAFVTPYLLCIKSTKPVRPIA